ncbi:MAG: adenylate/guanylate cyclase domain-containing protein [Deltaproteobacteria bacterium]|nr:MAG: adenylate/guanylate cyclase domain-containing protein [Deltaproteobacteria bacterium]
MKIRAKLLLVIVPLLIFPLIFIGFTSYVSARSGITKVAKKFLSYKVTEMYKFCNRQVEILRDTGLINDDTYVNLAKKSAIDYADTIGLSKTGYFMGVNSKGDVIFPKLKDKNVVKYNFFQEMKKNKSGLIAFNYDNKDRTGYYLYFEPWDWYILLSEEDTVFYQDANNIKKQVAYTLVITLAFAIVLILLFVKKVTDPIDNVVDTMKDIITSNDLSKRVKVEYDDEIGYLATWFNRMIEDLETAYNQIKEYAYKSVLAKNSEERIRHIFQKYVPAEIIDEVLRTKGEQLLVGKKQVATILFSDIRSFTTISEKLSAEELVKSLNTYFNIMVNVIIEHKGTIDKFIGDAIMAIFGAPVKHEDDPLEAVLTGLNMIKNLHSFNKKQIALNRPPFKIGVGINTGEVVVGNIGSTQKLDYTCIGDAVNLASRLEGLTKMYGIPIIISQFTYEETKTQIDARELDSVRVKGKLKPVNIYQPLDKDINSEEKEAYLLFNEGINLYRNREFQKALNIFKKTYSLLKNDVPSSLYIDRCNELIKNPPGENWDGVYIAKTK